MVIIIEVSQIEKKKNLEVIYVEMCVEKPKQWTSMSLSVSDERILLTAWWLAKRQLDRCCSGADKDSPPIDVFDSIAPIVWEGHWRDRLQDYFFALLRTPFMSGMYNVVMLPMNCLSGFVFLQISTVSVPKWWIWSDPAHLLQREGLARETRSDCGVFSLTFASVLAAGGHPSKYLFDPQAMSPHLHGWGCGLLFQWGGKWEKNKTKDVPSSHSCVLPLPHASYSFTGKMIQCDKWHCKFC